MSGAERHWADEYALLELRLADMTSERDAYRKLVQAALDRLRIVTGERDRARDRLRQLLDELRPQRHQEAA